MDISKMKAIVNLIWQFMFFLFWLQINHRKESFNAN